MHLFAAPSRSSLGRLVIAGTTAILLGACDDHSVALTAPDFSSPKRSLMCVKESQTGDAAEIVAPDAHGGCPYAFDIKVWY